MDWSSCLREGETVRWEGRPAPRCFTFRNWRHSLFGLFLMIIAVYWQIVALELAMAYGLSFIAWIPLPVLLASLYLSLGHLLLSRLEWERVFYAITDRRVLALSGIRRQRLNTLPLAQVTYFRLKYQAENLGTIRIHDDRSSRPLVLHCLEHPRRATDLLEEAMETVIRDEGRGTWD
jgi:hypothetical protein